MYWHQSFNQAPWLVKRCVDQWKMLHPDWEVQLLDINSVLQFVEPLPIKDEVLKKMLIQHRSDLIRTQLLIKYGGVWADPTTFCMISLDSWIDECMPTGLFLFRNPGRDRIISNWFMAANPNNEFLIELFRSLCHYWNKNDFKNFDRKKKTFIEKWLIKILNRNLDLSLLWFSPLVREQFKLFPYMVYHYKFYELYKSNTNFKNIVDSMPYHFADLPHTLKREGLLNPLREGVKKQIDSKGVPLYKLGWKIKDENQLPKDSVLSYLLSKSY